MQDDARNPVLLDTRQHYDSLVAEFGNDHRACGWGSRESQQKRFAVFAAELPLGGTILDVGCGLGDFYGFLQREGIRADYRGVDLSPSMVAAARQTYDGAPGAEFAVEDILTDPDPRVFDYVVASGIFTYIGPDNQELFGRLVEALFARCRRAVAFNSLSAWAPETTAGEFHADPLDAARLASKLTRRLRVRTDYHPHDFTLVLHRDGAR